MKRFPNPWAPKVAACVVCHGMRVVYRPDHSARPCPNCGCQCEPRSAKEKAQGLSAPSCPNNQKFRNLEADAWFANNTKPVLAEKELTEKERRHVGGWRIQFPKYSILTFLSWIEGLRYTDAVMQADKQFQKEMFNAIGQWKQFRDEQAEAMR